MNNSILEKSVDALLTRRSDAPFIRDFTPSKQVELFETLKQLRFNGQLILTNSCGRKWILHVHRGLIIYATGGEHPVRRWRRNLATHLPQIASDRLLSNESWENQLATTSIEGSSVCWQYQLLTSWLERQQITPEQMARIAWSVIIEVLFDVTQAVQVAYELKPSSSKLTPVVAIDAAQAIAEVERLWQAWQANRLNYSPNSAPVIKQSAELQHGISAPAYQALSQLLDGQHTLRDIATQMQRDVNSALRSLLPYIQSGFVELINIPDLAAPVLSSPTPHETQAPLIACVDDSSWVCHIMEKVMTTANYRFVGVNDALRAIGVLLAIKPDLIFLDLMMPNINGYELCSRLRQLSCFQHTPIVILTGNDGIIDRVRAKIVGSSDFLGKPIDPDRVLGAIHKHLKHSA
ncbi:response regulator [Scytonema millei]|uniref:response regulator n=1 Tax=Scytonema millei TaxID=1245922 RepID=UPI0019149D7C|nr:response regulator [Scytonema millei]